LNKIKILSLLFFLLIAGSMLSAQENRYSRIPLPDQEAPREVILLEPPTIDIKVIEESASEEAERTQKDYDILVLQKLQMLVDRFIAGELYMNEQDMKLIEMFLERRGNIVTVNK